ncbi:MAG: hypothetical protein M1818_004807 [Claussenomyces sp. TS43310]|nr:MAG: hypothetical protein M1818_004807 [Claussenomyces sp. TS43310]
MSKLLFSELEATVIDEPLWDLAGLGSTSVEEASMWLAELPVAVMVELTKFSKAVVDSLAKADDEELDDILEIPFTSLVSETGEREELEMELEDVVVALDTLKQTDADDTMVQLTLENEELPTLCKEAAVWTAFPMTIRNIDHFIL